MSDKKRAGYVVRMPLWKVLNLDPAYLQHEIERAAHEFGYVQATREADRFGPVEASLYLTVALGQDFEVDE